MLGWFKKLFGAVDVIVEQAPEPAPQPVVEEKPKAEKPKKKAQPKKTAEVDLESMSKMDLDIHARKLGLKIDRRRTKNYIIEQIQNHNKEN